MLTREAAPRRRDEVPAASELPVVRGLGAQHSKTNDVKQPGPCSAVPEPIAGRYMHVGQIKAYCRGLPTVAACSDSSRLRDRTDRPARTEIFRELHRMIADA